MSGKWKRILFLTPRVLCLLFCIFISLFALDVFSEGHELGEMILGFVIHLIPTFIILLILILTWRRDILAGILFISVSILFHISSSGEGWIISLLLILIGILYLASWFYSGKLMKNNKLV